MTTKSVIGHLGFWALFTLAWLACLPGCAASSKAACTDAETFRIARKIIVPKLASALVCSAEVETQEEVLACVEKEFEALRTDAQPVAYSCAMALLSDAVSGVK
jgi:hypothetical protein